MNKKEFFWKHTEPNFLKIVKCELCNKIPKFYIKIEKNNNWVGICEKCFVGEKND